MYAASTLNKPDHTVGKLLKPHHDRENEGLSFEAGDIWGGPCPSITRNAHGLNWGDLTTAWLLGLGRSQGLSDPQNASGPWGPSVKTPHTCLSGLATEPLICSLHSEGVGTGL